MKYVNLRLLFNPEPWLQGCFNAAEALIRTQLFDVPILHKELRDDLQAVIGTIVYMHSIRQEREGYRCRFHVIAYEHKIGETPPRGPVRAYLMEYPLITLKNKGRVAEYTVPTLEAPWAN